MLSRSSNLRIDGQLHKEFYQVCMLHLSRSIVKEPFFAVELECHVNKWFKDYILKRFVVSLYLNSSSIDILVKFLTALNCC